MKYLITCSIFLSLLLFSLNGFSIKQEAGSGMLYGKSNAYTISAPAGWIFDNESGVSQGLYAVIYPKNETWANASVVMYSRAVIKNEKQTLEDIIKNDYADFKKTNPKVIIMDHDAITTNDGKNAVVKVFAGDKWNNKEMVAYIDTGKTAIIIVMSSRNVDDFNKGIEAFKSVVGSFKFISDNVTIKP